MSREHRPRPLRFGRRIRASRYVCPHCATQFALAEDLPKCRCPTCGRVCENLNGGREDVFRVWDSD